MSWWSNEFPLILFWICLILPVYVYLGYPLLLLSGLLGRCGPVRRTELCPTVSIIVPAYNEEKTIARKIRNLLALDYPRNRLQILIGNDGSSDRTAEIVRSFADQGLILIDVGARRGKSAIQNDLVTRSSGSILFFTDADSLLPRDAIRTLVQNFSDPRVGLVTSWPIFLNTNANSIVQNETFYWRYEHWLRQQESDRGLLAMASGLLFALRRQLWEPLDPTVGDDFVLPLQVALRGFRNVVDPLCSARTELTQTQPNSMFRMKMRIISKDLRGLLSHLEVLNPFRTGAIAVGLLSHKLLRWFVPYALLGLFLSNLVLFRKSFYAFFFVAQIVFYLFAIAGVRFGRGRTRLPLSAASSFCLVNLAALFGTLHCLCGRSMGQWKTVR